LWRKVLVEADEGHELVAGRLGGALHTPLPHFMQQPAHVRMVAPRIAEQLGVEAPQRGL
jgi:hypothetical protein